MDSQIGHVPLEIAHSVPSPRSVPVPDLHPFFFRKQQTNAKPIPEPISYHKIVLPKEVEDMLTTLCRVEVE